jgi:hypothetical protein
MNLGDAIRSELVAVRRRATSAEPPHATSPFPRWSSSRRAPHPFLSTAILDTPGVLLKGLRCYPAACPLPTTIEGYEKKRAMFFGDFQ